MSSPSGYCYASVRVDERVLDHAQGRRQVQLCIRDMGISDLACVPRKAAVFPRSGSVSADLDTSAGCLSLSAKPYHFIADPVQKSMLPNAFDQQMLDTGDGHLLYFAQYGKATAPAAVVLHGGPGSGTSPSVLEWFDLSRQRVVLFDQRGAGQSQPQG